MAGFTGYVVSAGLDIQGSMGCDICPPCPPCPPGHFYRMRANDTTLARVVFWKSNSIDTMGLDYVGPGPLTDIVVQNLKKG